MSDETDRPNALRNIAKAMYWRDRAFTGKDAETCIYAADEIERLREREKELEGVLRKVKEACLFIDDDGLIGVSEDVVIPTELFIEINDALKNKEDKPHDE